MSVIRTTVAVMMVVANSLSAQGSGSVSFFEPPLLSVEVPYIDINSSATLEINCIGKHPVSWKLPDGQGIQIDDRYVFVQTSIELTRTGSIYGARMTLSNVSFIYTGLYTCHYNNTTDYDFQGNATSVYIFVNDPVNLFVDKSSIAKGHLFVLLRENRKKVLDCLPTSSKSNVTLWKVEGDIEEMVSLGSDIIFDPTQGFTIFYPTFYFDGFFQCRAVHQGVQQLINVTMVFMEQTQTDPDPFIDGSDAIHPVLLGNFNLKCIVSVALSTRLFFTWSYPNKAENSSRINDTIVKSEVKTIRNYMHKEVVSYLYVTKAKYSDSGLYKCTVIDHDEKTASTEIRVSIYASRQPTHVNFTTDIDLTRPVVYRAGKDIQLVIFVKAYPSTMDVVLYWLKDGELYPSDPQFQLKTVGAVKLEISNLSRSDAGVYTLIGKTADSVNNISIVLDVEDSPVVKVLKAPSYFIAGREYRMECHADSIPPPVVWWRWKPCKQVDKCHLDGAYGFLDVEANNTFDNDARTISKRYGPRNHSSVSYLTINATMSGHYMCIASNDLGQDDKVVVAIVTDAENGFEVVSTDNYPVEGDEVIITCRANAFDYSQIQWKWISEENNKNSILVRNTSDTVIDESHSDYSHSSSISFNPIWRSANGIYVCEAKRNDDNNISTSLNITIAVQGIQRPVLNKTNMNGLTISNTPGNFQEFYCYVDGVPTPSLTWLKDGILFDVTNMSGVELVDEDQKLILKRLLDEDSGFYECIAENRGGKIKTNATLRVLSDVADTGLSTTEITVIAIVVIAGCLFLVPMFFLVKKVREERKQRKELDFLNQCVFERGYVEIFNPTLPLQEQVDLLPYKNQWEFPKERLRLGRTLGQGAFGRVVKAEAIGIVHGEVSTTVAVKMLKETANAEQRKALIGELKILIYLGKHLNIVNLLGAVTKNLAKGELMVMVEYCCFGNLRHYLLKHKQTFINQLDPVTGDICLSENSQPGTPIISSKDMNALYADTLALGLDNPSYGSNFLKYADLAHQDFVLDPSNNRYFQNHQDQSNSDESDDGRLVTTCNLLCFAFQCARGMEYLASRKLIHRDLAARNVLLAEDNVVKICDFGLSKDCHNYKYSNYVKKTSGLLPIKWLAIESICDRVFTSKSDVWSFGILLWEMFTLGGNPYPGIEVNDEFVKKLKNGYRLEKPEFAPPSIYDVMKKCWLTDPKLRPDFSELSEIVGSLLEAGVRKYYMELNAPYQVLNSQLFNNNDYLEMNSVGSCEDYTKMTNNTLQNDYLNLSAITSLANGNDLKVPIQVVPMIQFDGCSHSEPTVRKSSHHRSLSVDLNISMNSKADEDDDSVFLDDTKLEKNQTYINGFLKAIHSSEISTRC